MNLIDRIHEKGQAIVYLAVGMIVFMGFVALSIDGGMALADRRNLQNVADSASLAGGGSAASYLESSNVTLEGWNCVNDNRIHTALISAESTAITRAAANNISIDDDPSDHKGVTAECGSTTYGWYLDKYIDVTVSISATTQSNFLHLIFPNALHNEVEAVTRIRPRQPLGFGNAIIALNPTAACGPKIGFATHGNATVNVSGGGIFSNGCIHANGKPTITVTGGAGIYGHYMDLGGGNWSPTPQQTTFNIPASTFKITRPDCSNPAAHNVSNLPNNMEPGLYCVSGNLSLKGTIRGSGVTIYVPNGGININGNADVQLSAPENGTDSFPAIPGLLWYLPESNPAQFTMNGTADIIFVGTILAPSTSICLLGTNFTDGYQTQVIGWDVEVGGTADTFVRYNGDQQFNLPTTIELAR
jgi:hypothetical protein